MAQEESDNSSCDPYKELLTAFQNQNLDLFRNLLEDPGFKQGVLDIDHCFEDPHNGSLLDITCRDPGNSLYIEQLLLHGADPNKINQEHHRGPIHSVIAIDDKEALKVLLQDDRTDVNLQEELAMYTALHFAVRLGSLESIDLLLKKGADIGARDDVKTYPAILYACDEGNLEALKIFYEHNKKSFMQTADDGRTVLHAVILGYIGVGLEKKKALDACLKYIIDCYKADKIHLNQVDNEGLTALDQTAFQEYDEPILLLLRHGAYIGTRDLNNELALDHIPPKVLKTSLDECLQFCKEDCEAGVIYSKDDRNCKLIFRYNFLVPLEMETKNEQELAEDSKCEGESIEIETFPLPKGQAIKPDTVSEIDPLLWISQSDDLRHLLSHPVLASFIHIKWLSLRQFFYVNLSFYVIFWFLISFYTLTFYVNQITSYEEDGMEYNIINYFLRILLFIFLSFFFLRELLQVIVSPIHYFKSLENWLEISLILMTSFILFDVFPFVDRNQISALTILFSWTELVLLIGRYPALSTYFEMIKIVSGSFIQLLIWYSIVILAFALSLYALFKDTEGNQFFGPGNSIFKTFIMITGEFDSGTLPFEEYVPVGHILFVLFVLFIAIVLVSILNGMAVSDINEIKETSRILGIISTIHFICYMENTATGKNKLSSLFSKVIPFKIFSFKSRLFLDIPNQEIVVFPNNNMKVQLNSSTPLTTKQDDQDDSSSTSKNTTSFFPKFQHSVWMDNIIMDPLIVKEAMAIIDDRGTTSDSLEEKLNKCQDKLESLEKILEGIANTLKVKHDSSDSTDSN
ncbi:hypothetical protein WDU94_006670 [Cyamophila willieti]